MLWILKKPKRLPTPPGWQVQTSRSTWGFANIAWSNRQHKLITVCEPKWAWFLLPIRRHIINALYNHELAHAWGVRDDGGIPFQSNPKAWGDIPGSKDLSYCKKASCVSFESEMWGVKESWWEELVHAMGLLWSGFKHCEAHTAFITHQINMGNIGMAKVAKFRRQ